MVEKKSTFPIMPISNWWALRSRFKQSIPTIVSPGYIATVLNMKEKSAQVNIIPNLCLLGIIDADGKPLERATQWRDDKSYPIVCKELLKEVYPNELLEALPGPILDRDDVERWFANKTGLGEKSVNKMAAFYELLSAADPSGSQGLISNKKSTKQPAKSIEQTTKSTFSKQSTITPPITGSKNKQDFQASIHLDIQIHISPDASPEQIEQIFASMAKHLIRD